MEKWLGWFPCFTSVNLDSNNDVHTSSRVPNLAQTQKLVKLPFLLESVHVCFLNLDRFVIVSISAEVCLINVIHIHGGVVPYLHPVGHPYSYRCCTLFTSSWLSFDSACKNNYDLVILHQPQLF